MPISKITASFKSATNALNLNSNSSTSDWILFLFQYNSPVYCETQQVAHSFNMSWILEILETQ